MYVDVYCMMWYSLDGRLVFGKWFDRYGKALGQYKDGVMRGEDDRRWRQIERYIVRTLIWAKLCSYILFENKLVLMIKWLGCGGNLVGELLSSAEIDTKIDRSVQR